MSCGPAGLDPVRLVASWLDAGRAPSWPQLPRGRTLFTHQGRGAISIACSLLGIGPADEVLMPSWNCGTEVDAVRSSGARVTLYRVDESAQVDLEDLGRRIGPATRAVYVIHYFGWPQELAPVRELCRERDLLLLEDCALSLFSSPTGGALGTNADAAFFSFPKSLAVPDGGALVLKDAVSERWPSLTAPSPARIARRCAGLVRKRYRRGVAPSRASSGSRPDMPASYYFDGRSAHWAASRVTMGLLSQTAPARIAERRRANFERLHARLAEVRGVRPLFDRLPTGVVPLEMPVLVEDRARWMRELAARSVASLPWWAGYHRGLAWDDFPEACALKDRLLALPVHQELDSEGMDYVAAQVEALASSRRRGAGARSAR